MVDSLSLVGNGGEPSKLLKTGQTTDRTPAGRTSKDDGGEQKGELHNYEVKDTGQYSGTTDITVNAKTNVHSNEVVLDRTTNLMWSRTLSDSVGPASDGLLLWDDTAGSDEDIFEFCDQANLASLSGHNDWRVPNLAELFALMQFNVTTAAPDDNFFPASWGANVHSSTTRPNAVTSCMTVSFASSIITVSGKTTILANAALVRLGFN